MLTAERLTAGMVAYLPTELTHPLRRRVASVRTAGSVGKIRLVEIAATNGGIFILPADEPIALNEWELDG